jgi:hypothetical protein
MRVDSMDRERQRLQALFASCNDHGARVGMAGAPPDDAPIDLGLGVEFVVTRVAPRIVDGRVRSDLWLRWKASNYTDEPQGTHTLKVIQEVRTDGRDLILVDDQDRTFRLAPAPESQWQAWLAWKRTHQDDIQTADAIVNAEHQRIAEEWDGRTQNSTPD